MARQIQFETDTFRVSFPYLAVPNTFNNQDPTYQIDAIFDPQTTNTFWQTVVQKGQEILAQEYPGQENLFQQWPSLKEGNTNTDQQGNVKNGYAGNFFIKMKNKEQIGCVKFDQAMNCDVNIDPKQIYSGCYARAYIELWLQDNDYGKRVNLKLLALKFVADGESLGGAVPVDATTAFSSGAPATPPGAAVTQQPMQTVHQNATVSPAPMIPPAAQPPQQYETQVAPGIVAPAQQHAVPPVPPAAPGIAPATPAAPPVPPHSAFRQ